MITTVKTYKELVLEREPTAWAECLLQSVNIRVRKLVTNKCCTCGQDWARLEVDHSRAPLGSGPTEEVAWWSVAHDLGLLK